MIIDVSHHNGKIDWIKASGVVSEAFIKSSEGRNFKDSAFLRNAAAASSSGIRVGYYHFASLNDQNSISDAKFEAEFFISLIKKAPCPQLPLVLDVEVNKLLLSNAKVEIFIKTFFEELHAAGYDNYMLYSGTHFLNNNLPRTHQLGTVKLWIADYNPPIFTPYGWTKIDLWQYTDKGKVIGIKGNVDLNLRLQ